MCPHLTVMSIDVLDIYFFFFFNDTATTEIYTLSLHDALPISSEGFLHSRFVTHEFGKMPKTLSRKLSGKRSEEHTSELQSRLHLVCRLLLEKKKKTKLQIHIFTQLVSEKMYSENI